MYRKYIDASEMKEELIASCGFNCTLCHAYQKKGKGACSGCNGDEATKQIHCAKCAMRTCDAMKSEDARFCFECDKFPCQRLKQFDAKYRKQAQISMIENLEYIKINGTDKFIEKELERWTCKACGSIGCIHTGMCVSCGNPIIKQTKDVKYAVKD